MIDLPSHPAGDPNARHRHAVQLCDIDDRALIRNLAQYVSDGLGAGEAAVVITAPEHRKALTRRLRKLGIDPRAVRDGRLSLLDASETLRTFMRDGMPDTARFRAAIGGAIARLPEGIRGLRCYGEMVGILWENGHRDAAIALEDLWNELIEARSFQLLCGYPIGIFGEDFQLAEIDRVFCSHTAIVPAGSTSALTDAIDRAMDEVLGLRAERLRGLMKPNYRPAWPALPRAEAAILWLRNNIPDEADAVLRRARELYAARPTR
jgi:hypothetical protein